MMRKPMRFLLTALLALTIALALSGVAYAEDLIDVNDAAALQPMIDIATNGAIVQVNVAAGPVTIPAGKNITLQLNASITATGDTPAITNNGILTIEGSGTISAVTIAIQNEGTLTIRGGTFSGNQTVVNGGHGHLEIYDGTFTATGNGAMTVCNHGDISDSSFSSTSQTVANEANGRLTISGGTFSATGSGAVTVYNDGTVTITNGSFTSDGSDAEERRTFTTTALRNAGTANISGGSFNSKTEGSGGGAVRNTAGTTTISGGTFDSRRNTLSVIGGTMTITNATVTGQSRAIYAGGGTVKITDGSFEAEYGDSVVYAGGENTVVDIDGGTFVHLQKTSSFEATLITEDKATVKINGYAFTSGAGNGDGNGSYIRFDCGDDLYSTLSASPSTDEVTVELDGGMVTFETNSQGGTNVLVNPRSPLDDTVVNTVTIDGTEYALNDNTANMKLDGVNLPEGGTLNTPPSEDEPSTEDEDSAELNAIVTEIVGDNIDAIKKATSTEADQNTITVKDKYGKTFIIQFVDEGKTGIGESHASDIFAKVTKEMVKPNADEKSAVERKSGNATPLNYTVNISVVIKARGLGLNGAHLTLGYMTKLPNAITVSFKVDDKAVHDELINKLPGRNRNYCAFNYHDGDGDGKYEVNKIPATYDEDTCTFTITSDKFSHFTIGYEDVVSKNPTGHNPTRNPDPQVNAPNTFDAGIGAYTVTAILSATGMAWLRKKER